MRKGLVFVQMLGIILLVIAILVATAVLSSGKDVPWDKLWGEHCGDGECDTAIENYFTCPLDCKYSADDTLTYPSHIVVDTTDEEIIDMSSGGVDNYFAYPLGGHPEIKIDASGVQRNIFVSSATGVLVKTEECNDCHGDYAANCFYVSDFVDAATCYDCFDCNATGYCTTCYACDSAEDEVHSAIPYNNCTICSECNSCDVIDTSEITIETSVTCDSCEMCDSCEVSNIDTLISAIDANPRVNQAPLIKLNPNVDNELLCKYCSYGTNDYNWYLCSGCSNLTSPNYLLENMNCFNVYGGMCDTCEKNVEPQICDDIKNAIAEGGGLVDEFTVKTPYWFNPNTGPYNPDIIDFRPYEYIPFNIIGTYLSREALPTSDPDFSGCQREMIYKEASDGVYQEVCWFDPGVLGNVITESPGGVSEGSALSYIDCGAKPDVAPKLSPSNGVIINDYKEFFSITQMLSGDYLNIKLAVSNLDVKSSDCKFDLYYCVQPTLATDPEDKMVKLYEEIVNMDDADFTPFKEGFCNCGYSSFPIEYFSDLYSLNDFYPAIADMNASFVSNVFTFDLGTETYSKELFAETLKTAVIDWNIDNQNEYGKEMVKEMANKGKYLFDEAPVFVYHPAVTSAQNNFSYFGIQLSGYVWPHIKIGQGQSYCSTTPILKSGVAYSTSDTSALTGKVDVRITYLIFRRDASQQEMAYAAALKGEASDFFDILNPPSIAIMIPMITYQIRRPDFDGVSVSRVGCYNDTETYTTITANFSVVNSIMLPVNYQLPVTIYCGYPTVNITKNVAISSDGFYTVSNKFLQKCTDADFKLDPSNIIVELDEINNMADNGITNVNPTNICTCATGFVCEGQLSCYRNADCTRTGCNNCQYGCAGGVCNPPPNPPPYDGDWDFE